jgi:hypothetical protein
MKKKKKKKKKKKEEEEDDDDKINERRLWRQKILGLNISLFR